MCVLSTLCGKVDKHSPFDIYIYIYIMNKFTTFPLSNNAWKTFKITKDINAKLQKYIPMYSRAN